MSDTGQTLTKVAKRFLNAQIVLSITWTKG